MKIYHQVAGIAMVATTPEKRDIVAVKDYDRNHTLSFTIGSDRFMALHPAKVVR